MEDLEDDLDLRFHRGLNPEVYYRCPTLESLDAALRNEFEKNASSLIPVEIVTEFVFAAASTITIPVAEQPRLNALIEPADHLQSIIVDYALCRDIDGKDRLRAQRAIARSIVQTIQDVDGFEYGESSSKNKEGGDGARFKYVCREGLRYIKRKNRRRKKAKEVDSEDSNDHSNPPLQGYDCGGAIHIRFSIEREAVNVVYKHNPIHSSAPVEERYAAEKVQVWHGRAVASCLFNTFSNSGSKCADHAYSLPTSALDTQSAPQPSENKTPNRPTDQEKKRKRNGPPSSPHPTPKSTKKQSMNGREPLPSTSVKGKACIRCRDMKIVCNQDNPTCNQCQRGLWTCQYEVAEVRKRSKNGCLNCKAKKRKCTEERPSCARCLRINKECEYADYS